MGRRANINKNTVKRSAFPLAKKVRAYAEENLSIIQRVVVYFAEPTAEEITKWSREDKANIRRRYEKIFAYIKRFLGTQHHSVGKPATWQDRVALKIMAGMYNDKRTMVLRNTSQIQINRTMLPELTGFEDRETFLCTQLEFFRTVVKAVWWTRSKVSAVPPVTSLSPDQVGSICSFSCDIEAQHWLSDVWEKWERTICMDDDELTNVMQTPAIAAFLLELDINAAVDDVNAWAATNNWPNEYFSNHQMELSSRCRTGMTQSMHMNTSTNSLYSVPPPSPGPPSQEMVDSMNRLVQNQHQPTPGQIEALPQASSSNDINYNASGALPSEETRDSNLEEESQHMQRAVDAWEEYQRSLDHLPRQSPGDTPNSSQMSLFDIDLPRPEPASRSVSPSGLEVVGQSQSQLQPQPQRQHRLQHHHPELQTNGQDMTLSQMFMPQIPSMEMQTTNANGDGGYIDPRNILSHSQ